mmetsp:Transcript_50641/g.151448  ORF Transcript_50641/g.151448 Transcript_50641/m.151448 type:complete len:696 (+) Transcript_50641:23-2110(+)
MPHLTVPGNTSCPPASMSMTSALDRSYTPKEDSRFRAALEHIAEVHGREILNLEQENQHLRNQIVQLREHLKQFQARSICAKIDEPKMQSVAQSVAEDVAAWIDDGGVENNGERDKQAAAASPAVGAAGPKDRSPSPATRKTSLRRPQVEESDKAVSFTPDPDITVLHEVDQSNDDISVGPDQRADDRIDECEDNQNRSVWSSQLSAQDAKFRNTLGSGSVDGDGKSQSRKRKSIHDVLLSAQGEEVRLLAEKTLSAAERHNSFYVNALNQNLHNNFSTDEEEEEESAPALQRRGVSVWRRLVRRLVRNTAFDGLCAVMILGNSVLIGWSTEHLTSPGAEETGWMVVLGHFFTGFFLVELILRMLPEGTLFFHFHEGWFWNWFDFALVAVSIVEFLLTMNGQGGNWGGSVKTIKMLRILRLFRVFRFFKDLSLLALMVIDSMKSLGNALVMLAIIMYVFAIMFTSEATGYLQSVPDRTASEAALVWQYFGTLKATSYALLQAMLGGVSWGVLTDALLEVDLWFSAIIFFLYVFFTMLAVLNIITGVFVDNAVETARTQRDYLVQKEMEVKEMYVKEMQKLFSQMDEDQSGTVCLEEVKEYFQDPHVKSYFTALGLDPHDSERLFTLLDDDGSGDVGVNEFINGCLRLKGQARSIDIYALLVQGNRLENKLREVMDNLPRSFRKSQHEEFLVNGLV